MEEIVDIKRTIQNEIAKGGRERILDLRDAVGLEPAKPKEKVAMNDVFQYGFAAEADVTQLTGKNRHVAKTSATALEELEKRTRPKAKPHARRRMSTRRRVFTIAQYPVIAGVAISAAYSTSIGQWFVLLYAIYAVWRKVDSRYSFGSAIFLLVTVPFFQAIGQSGIAQNAAVYVFELLVIGTIQAVFELRKTSEVPG